MELRHLRYFVAVAEELSFSRAAERLNKAQPPLSRQIQDLEYTVGVKLFVRGGKRLDLTPAGHAFLKEARLTLEQSERAIRAARLAAAGTTVLLRVGYMALGLYAEPVLALFREFRTRFPAIQASLTLMPPAAQLAALTSKQIDVGIMHADCAPGDQFAADRIHEEPLDFMFPLGHRLAARDALRLADLAGEPFVMFPRDISPIFYDRLLGAWRSGGFEPSIVRESDSFPTTVMIVASGAGISFAGREIGAGLSANVVIRPAVDFSFRLAADIVRLRNNDSPALAAFDGYVRETMRMATARR